MDRFNKGKALVEFPESYIVVDIETTGFSPEFDSIIEVAGTKYKSGIEIEHFSSLLMPDKTYSDGSYVDSFIERLTGITNKMLSSSPDTRSVLQKFSDFLGDFILIGHNVNFDINFLYDNFMRYLNKPLSNNYMDTMRLSQRYIKNAPSYKLSALAEYLGLPPEQAHRASCDCQTTNQLFLKLREISFSLTKSELILLDSIQFDTSNPYYKKRVAIKGIPQLYSFAFMKSVAEKCDAEFSDIFFKSCDFIIFSKYTYQKYINGENSEKFLKANALAGNGSLTILSEFEWYESLNIPAPQPISEKSSLSAKDITTNNTDFDETHPLFNKLCVFTGTLEKMTRKNAMQMVVDSGGQIGNSITQKTNYLVLGNNDYCPLIKDGKSSKQKKAEALKLLGYDIEVVSENVFYEMFEDV